jgi:L-seryl-tRNA(Ser) seleniumtransferase
MAYEAGTALETIPTLRLLTEPLASIRRRARRLLARVPGEARARLDARVVESRSQVGGGALPTVELPTAALALGSEARPARGLDERLRRGEPAAIGRIANDRLLLDCRTVLPSQVADLARLLSEASA